MEDLNKVIIENEQSIKSAHKRIDKLEEGFNALHKLVTSVEVIALETKANREAVDKLDGRLSEIEKKPAKKWEDIEKIIITGIASAILGFVLAKFGL